MKNIKGNKLIWKIVIVAVITILLEIFAFNFSSWYSKRLMTVDVAKNATTDESGYYYSEIVTVDTEVRNVDVDATVANYDLAYVSVILTDKGDKYEYATPEYTICNGIRRSGFSNIYPFGEVHTIQVAVRAEDGCPVTINSIRINSKIPVDLKPLRMLIIFGVLLFGVMVFSDSKLHEIYFDEKKTWQWCVTIAVMLVLMYIGVSEAKADKLLLESPWPHHKQYQELARSLKNGSVELTEQYVDPALIAAQNPYDTIALMVENVEYSMDYAFYNGKYYAYFGIVPEVLFYYPYLTLKGGDLPNYYVGIILTILLVPAVFWLVSGLVRKYSKSMPYFYYLLLCIGMVGSANFVYLIGRPDIYNIPILSASVFTIIGLAGLLESTVTKKKWARMVTICLGALSMALVAGCRPQFLIFSGIAVIWLFCDEGWKERKIFSKDSIVESILFVVPYILVAILVCWYNYARFGNILDFGATYSLTSNDMNNRGFNMNRLLRSLYCYMLQPAVINTDFPFLNVSFSGGEYMGKFLYEYTYGGVLVSNMFLVSIWIGLLAGLKKIKNNAKSLILYLIISAIIVGAFDANMAGVLYRYTCDFAIALVIAATVLWIVFLDKSQNVINYRFASRIVYVCVIVALIYSLLTVVATGSSVCLKNDNRQLYYSIASYFKF